MSLTTWNPSDATASCSLSGGNLIATAGAGNQAARNTLYKSSGKWYYEALMTNASEGSGDTGCGVASSAYTLGDNGSNGATDMCYWAQNSTVYCNGADTGLTSLADGDTVGIAIDIPNTHIWFRKNGGTWNNDILANQNPVGNVGGINLTSLGWSWTSLTPVVSMRGVGDSITANFGASAFSTSPPSGFSAWNPYSVNATQVSMFR